MEVVDGERLVRDPQADGDGLFVLCVAGSVKKLMAISALLPADLTLAYCVVALGLTRGCRRHVCHCLYSIFVELTVSAHLLKYSVYWVLL